MASAEYSVYILRCGDETYYTGITTDVERRIREHQEGQRGARYLQGRGPLTLVFSAPIGNRSAASQMEYRIKRLDRRAKEALISGKKPLPVIDAA